MPVSTTLRAGNSLLQSRNILIGLEDCELFSMKLREKPQV
jgi:hypothetical protein